MTVAQKLKLRSANDAVAQALRVVTKHFAGITVRECIFVDGSSLTIREYVE